MRYVLQHNDCGSSSRASGRKPFLLVGPLPLLGAVACVLISAGVTHAQQGSVLLKEGAPTAAVLDMDADPPMTTFSVSVPKDAVLMTVKISRTPVILDILARKKQPIEVANDAEYRSNAEMPTQLLISRQSAPALEDGTYHIAVTYLGAGLPIIHKRPVKKVPFTVTVSFVRGKVDGVLTIGQKLSGQTRVEEGSMRTFVVDVPEGAKALRIDLDEVSGMLDIWAKHGAPVYRGEDADETVISALGRKTLLVEGPSLKPGRWFINIVRPADIGMVDFTLYASLSAQPPPVLLELPTLVAAADARKRAIQATVDVATEDGGGGSGTMLVADGLVLTNYHVLEEAAGNAEQKDAVIIGVTLDPRQSARELFRGNVLAFNKKIDLALVQVTCGLYRQPLPPGYRFPAITLGDPDALEIGDKVTTVGFPEIANTNGRASVTLTQGVLSGFEKTEIGVLLKTDAGISPGSSGGAALDSQWRLIGVPTFENVSPEEVSRMAYIHPVSLLPEAWRNLIKQREKALGEPRPRTP